MNKKAMIAVAMAFNLAAGSVAMAQGNSNHGDRGRGDEQRNDRADRSDGRHDNRDFGRSHNEYAKGGRGAGPGNAYYKGDRYPAEYRNRQYVVNDWRGHHLSAPPRGYQWVQSGNDYVLIAIASGIIASLILGR
jgi:Ni/Co efflux regulator RcnB